MAEVSTPADLFERDAQAPKAAWAAQDGEPARDSPPEEEVLAALVTAFLSFDFSFPVIFVDILFSYHFTVSFFRCSGRITSWFSKSSVRISAFFFR